MNFLVVMIFIGIFIEMEDPKDGNKKKMFITEADQLHEGDHFSDKYVDGNLFLLYFINYY